MKTYLLKYQNQLLGKVQQLNADFPNLSGKIIWTESTDEKYQKIKKFTEFSIEYNAYLSKNNNVNNELFQKENDYLNLIESEDWTLLEETGEIYSILTPIFHINDEIVWRWK